jgi:hypothetical protein
VGALLRVAVLAEPAEGLEETCEASIDEDEVGEGEVGEVGEVGDAGDAAALGST